MLAVVVLPIALQALLTAPPPRARVPAEVSMAGLLELTRQGEVMLLPVHDTQPFNALLVTRSREPCETVAHEMMDVETWPGRWAIKDVHVDERTATSVKYSMQLDVALAPRVPGLIEHPSADKVIFNDIQTGAQFIWTLDANEGGCALRYSLLETPGKQSAWLSVIHTLEASAVDAANFAAALSSARGFTKPEQRGSITTTAGDAAFAALAAHGTALRVVRAPGKFPVIVARRVIERSVDDVLWAIRDKKRYVDTMPMMRKVKDHGKTAAYTVGAFGGRVSWETSVVESGDAHADSGLTFTEKVTGGDVETGTWVWHVLPVPGGTDVQLTWDVDVASGSTIMSTLADADPVAKESMSMMMALTFMGKVIDGKPLGDRALARAP